MSPMDKVVIAILIVVMVLGIGIGSLQSQKTSCADIEIRPDATEHQKDLCRRSR